MQWFLYGFVNSHKTDDTTIKIAVYLLIFEFITILSDAGLVTVEKLTVADVKFGSVSAISSIITFFLLVAFLIISVKINVDYQREAASNVLTSDKPANDSVQSEELRTVKRLFLENLNVLDRIDRAMSITGFLCLWAIPFLLGIRVSFSHWKQIADILKHIL
jgi:hypothetical protein